jgi:4-amino-4-deoxy-L-arabinose transferase-like glycosyltransferase
MRPRNRLGIILLVALALRLVVGLAEDHRLGYENGGGDITWLLANGYALAAGRDEVRLPDFGVDVYPEGYAVRLRNLPTPPLYLLFIGTPQTLLPREAAIIAIRIVQSLLSAATCYLAYRLGQTLTEDPRVGLVAAGALAISPAFILESAQIATETLYIFFIALALTIYLERHSTRSTALVGLLLGLATLTRAAALLFPLGLLLHLLMTDGPRRGLRRAVPLLLVYTLTVGSWTVYNLARWDRFVIAGEGFAAFLYLGATEAGWQGPDATDAALADDTDPIPAEPEDQQDVYLDNAQQLIGENMAAYVQQRVAQLAAAFLQPHGTLHFSGESLRDLVSNWLREDRSLTGLVRLAQADAFWPKLALYGFHYAALVFGIVGLWLTRHRWRQSLPLAGFILYTTLIHLVLFVLPRYIFPTEVFWWVFAAATLVAIYQRFRHPSAQPIAITGQEKQWL